MIKLFKFYLVVILLSAFKLNAQDLEISNLKVTSGKNYLVKYNSFYDDSLQYIDRNYRFDKIPDDLKGVTLIITAGNDKMFEENEICFSFNVNKAVIVHILYADKYPILPNWLLDYKKTEKKVYRHDSSNDTMKGIFTVYSKEFLAGEIQINGCLGKGIKTEKFIKSGGSGYCMFSVVIEEIK